MALTRSATLVESVHQNLGRCSLGVQISGLAKIEAVPDGRNSVLVFCVRIWFVIYVWATGGVVILSTSGYCGD